MPSLNNEKCNVQSYRYHRSVISQTTLFFKIYSLKYRHIYVHAYTHIGKLSDLYKIPESL